MERRLITQSYKSPPDKSPQPAAIGAVHSAVPPSFHFGAKGAVHVASRRLLNFLRRRLRAYLIMNTKIAIKIAVVGAFIVAAAYWLRGHDILTGLALLLLLLVAVAKMVGAIISRRGGSSPDGGDSGSADRPVPKLPGGHPPTLVEANEVRH